jgi:predicted acetyltransferase
MRYMDKFKFEIPTKERKQDAIDFINEFYEYNSDINGTGGLQRYLDNYDGWLEKLEEDYKRIPNEEKVPAKTYFLVRESDNRIVGMINIRLVLNERLKKYGGHIGYCIRPTERGKGYNKINLYLGLKICKEHGIKEVFMDADKENLASWKTMESLGGINIREYYDDEYAHCVVKDYTINVDNAIEENRKKYEHLVSDNIITQKL